jgi:coniferyl-aldehyde dehydrogenase
MNRPWGTEKSRNSGIAAMTFDRLKKAYAKQPLIPFEQRKEMLQQIEEILLENDEAICEAINKDFSCRSYYETKILEISPTVLGIRSTVKHLKRWIKPQKRHVSIMFFGGKNVVIPQAKGVVGIITPWNYPLFLSMSPLTSAIAAGNRVMVKLAANSQNLAKLLQKLFSKIISEDYIAIVPGVKAADFSSLPFDHLVFTGSPAVGRTIMGIASKNLTPVTLELGGKSPTILAEDFDLRTAVGRILYSKLINSGQTCVSPDYIFVPERKIDEFVKEAGDVAAKRYPDIGSKDYTCIIDEKAFKRLTETLADAKKKGADIISLIPGNEINSKSRKIQPMIIKNVTDKMRIMQEEIFGPLLPVMSYKKIDDVITYINQHERPLALYLYSNDKKLQHKLLANTISGGVTINDCIMHLAQHDMPFGGVGNSGMGQYHAFEGFLEMSKMKPVFIQSKFAVPLAPPYGKFIEKIYSLVKKQKWLS